MQQKDSLVANSIVDRWKKYVVAGNKNLVNEQFDAAVLQYEFARKCAEIIFEEWSNPNEAASALVVTYHNLADLQRKLGNSSAILFYLEKAHNIVLKSLISVSVDDERHLALLDASKRTYSALVSYKKCGVYN